MSPSHPLDNRPPLTLVNVEVVDELWLFWDPARGHWTLRASLPEGQSSPDDLLKARVLPRGTVVTLLWPGA